jgi:hypothetical protein
MMISPVLEDASRLSTAANAFHEEKHHLVYSAARDASVPRYVWERVGTTGDDVLSAAEALAGEYLRAEQVFADFVTSEEGMITFPEGRRLETAFKGVHMWLRAYQDSACGLLLARWGERVGAYTSMSKALKPGKPVADFLAEQLPPYEQWFRDWRARRDQMKLGARFEVVFETDPPRIRGLSYIFPRLATSTDVAEGAVGLEEIITGLGMSRRLTEVVRNQLEPSRS